METLAAVPIITALVEVFKRFIPEKYAALVAIVLGVGYVFGMSGISFEGFVWGIVFGLSASGLYDVAKKPIIQPINKMIK